MSSTAAVQVPGQQGHVGTTHEKGKPALQEDRVAGSKSRMRQGESKEGRERETEIYLPTLQQNRWQQGREKTRIQNINERIKNRYWISPCIKTQRSFKEPVRALNRNKKAHTGCGVHCHQDRRSLMTHIMKSSFAQLNTKGVSGAIKSHMSHDYTNFSNAHEGKSHLLQKSLHLPIGRALCSSSLDICVRFSCLHGLEI